MADLKVSVEVPVWAFTADGGRTHLCSPLILTTPANEREFLVEFSCAQASRYDSHLKLWVSMMDLEAAFAKIRGQR